MNVWEVIVRIWRLKERHGIESDPSLSAWYMRQVALTELLLRKRGKSGRGKTGMREDSEFDIICL